MKKFAKSRKAVLAVAGWALLASTNGQAAGFSSLQVVSNKATALTTGGAVSITVSIHKVADNSVDTAINWGSVAIPTTWKLAQDYILLDSQVSLSGGGIQTYTDNTANDATPKFTGNKTVLTPAGLIDGTDTTKKLSTAWSIQHTTGTVPSVDPNANAGTSYSWFYHEDKAQQAIPTSNAAAFANNDPYVTVQNTSGIHYASGPTQFGPNATGNPALKDSQNAIYIEANFTGAVGGRTYQTTTLRVEAYTD